MSLILCLVLKLDISDFQAGSLIFGSIFSNKFTAMVDNAMLMLYIKKC